MRSDRRADDPHAWLRGAALALALALIGAACAGTPPPSAETLASRELAFLADGRATREQALIRFGMPSRSFEGDRVLLYRLAWTEAKGLHPVAWHAPALPGYDLVLVFDARGRLERHALVAK